MTTENREESFKFYDSDGKSRSIYWMVRNEQSWAANRLVHGRRLEIKNKEQQVKIDKLQAENAELRESNKGLAESLNRTLDYNVELLRKYEPEVLDY